MLAVVVLATLAVAGVLAWLRLWQPLMADQAAQTRTLAELGQRLTSLETWQSSASDDLVTLEAHHRDLAVRLDQLEPARLNAWALAEADYLIRSAQRAAIFEHDPARAALALGLASASLAPVPGSVPARRALDSARTALLAVRVPDLDALDAELTQAARTLEAAPLREPGSAPIQPATGGWRGAIQQAWRQLGEVIVVQRVGTPVQPLLRPQESQYLRQQLALKLAAADYALMRRDSEALRRELADLSRWADAYLDLGDPATAGALATLARLAQVDLRAPLPDLSGLDQALAALRRATRGADDPA